METRAPSPLEDDGRNGVQCLTCNWTVSVPRRGAGQPFDAAMAFHTLEVRHYDFTFPVDSSGAPVIAEGELKMGAVYMAGMREGARQERHRISSVIAKLSPG
jgi:hypothetical protein